MRLPGLSVKRPPSSSEARKLRCFFKSRAVMLFSSSRDGSGRLAATPATASHAAISVAVNACFNESFGSMRLPSVVDLLNAHEAGTCLCAVLRAGSGPCQRADDHRRQVFGVVVGARHAPDIFNR